jgi:hypothetical protein
MVDSWEKSTLFQFWYYFVISVIRHFINLDITPEGIT